MGELNNKQQTLEKIIEIVVSCCRTEVSDGAYSVSRVHPRFRRHWHTNRNHTQGSQTQAPENVKCCNRAYGWSITTDITVTATFPAA